MNHTRPFSALPLGALIAAIAGCTMVGGPAEEFRGADEPVPAPTPYEVAQRHIDAADAARHVSFLAADDRRGRGTSGKGLERAAAWIATEFQRAGLEPAGDSSGYLQYWPYRNGQPGAAGSRESKLVPNVVGRLPGARPTQAGEYVILVAHYDHLGVGPAQEGDDSVYNGADDNASGVAALVEVAQAMGALSAPLPRPVLFLAVAGSEAGLLGSTWFADHPSIPLSDAVAVLDLDMVGRNHPDTIGVVGAGSAGLRALMRRLAGEVPRIRLQVVSDPPGAPELRAGDHTVFADRGIPAARVTSGLHADYHTPDDERNAVAPDKIARVARLVFLTAHHLATGGGLPE